MCLAIPGEVLELDPSTDVRMGLVAFGGIRRKVCLEHVPEVRVGQYVLVHVGYALAVLDEDEAKRMIAELTALSELMESELREGEDA
jgi:hydrogenase expression/formation protein HypC